MRSPFALLLVSLLFSASGFAQQPADAFQVGSVLNVPAPLSIDLSNASSRELCVNSYVFDKKDGNFVSCCSSLLSPNQAYTMSTRIGLAATGAAAPSSLTIKLLAT